MIICPACGKENDEAAVLCRRCRGPLRDEPEEETAPGEHAGPAQHEAPAHHEAHDAPAHHEAAAQAHEQPAATADEPTASSDSLGEVCRRCESYNEPGARRCSSCGYVLIPEDAPAQHEPVHHAEALEEPPLDKTPAEAFAPPHLAGRDEAMSAHDTPAEGSHSVADELSALAISPEEAAEAGMSITAGRESVTGAGLSHHAVEPHEQPPGHAPSQAHAEGELDETPPQAFRSPPPEAKPSLVARSKAAIAEAAGVAVGAATGVAVGAAAAVAGAVRRPAEPPPPPAPPPARSEPEQKACAECAAMNPPAAKFCFDCGTPFARKPAAPPPPKAVEPPKPVERLKAEEPPRVEAKPFTPMRIEPLPRTWADSTEPGLEAAGVHVEGMEVEPAGLESTTETPPISLSPDAHKQTGHASTEAAHDAPAFAEPEPEPQLEAAPSAEPAAFEDAAPLHDDHVTPLGATAVSPEAGHFEDPARHHAAVELAEPLLESEPAVELAEPLLEAEPVEELAEPLPEPGAEPVAEPEPVAELVAEPEPPFHATLVLEKGPAAGTAILLDRLENTVGGSSGAAVELADDASVAPHAATVAFADDRLVLRDEGSANGVYLKVRESAPLEPGDHFFAGERLLRFDGPCELPQTHEGEVPFLGAPRPQGAAVRVTEIVAGGKTGRTCHRSGPTISIGRTGCDMNFPADSLLGARHTELRLGEDGAASLVDLGQGPSGVFVRVRTQGTHELRAGDVLRVGEQELRVEIG